MFKISTEHPTAKDSMDTIHPKGTSMDNSFNVNFNLRVMKLFREMRGRPREPRCWTWGAQAAGWSSRSSRWGRRRSGWLEGSDYSLVHKRAAWDTVRGTCSRRTRRSRSRSTGEISSRRSSTW